MKRILYCVLLLVLCASTAFGQEVKTVLNVGSLAIDVAANSLAALQPVTFRAYVDAQPAVVMPTTCTGTSSPFQCTFPIKALNLPPTGTHTVSVTAGVDAADGTVESPKVAFPFLFRVGELPATPVISPTPILPPASQ